MAFDPSDTITLPIGLEWEGKRYRQVLIEEMTGYDEEALADKKHRNNGAKALTALLQRCVQGIPGLVETKKDRFSQMKKAYFDAMFTADRDYLFLAIRSLGMDPNFDMVIKCPACGDDYDHTVVVKDLDVLVWPEEEEAQIPISLPKGFTIEGKQYKDIVWRFPTGKDQERIATLPRAKITSSMITTCIQSVDGTTRKVDTEMVRRLRTRDRVHLMNVVQEMTPGVDLRMECYCEACEHEWVGDIEPSHFFSTGTPPTRKQKKGGKRGLKRRKRR